MNGRSGRPSLHQLIIRRSCYPILFRFAGTPSIARQDLEEAKMGTLVFVCPNSGREVFTGLEIDSASFQGLPKVLAEINCSDCCETHNLFEVRSRLVATPPEGSNHALPGTPDPIAD